MPIPCFSYSYFAHYCYSFAHYNACVDAHVIELFHESNKISNIVVAVSMPTDNLKCEFCIATGWFTNSHVHIAWLGHLSRSLGTTFWHFVMRKSFDLNVLFKIFLIMTISDDLVGGVRPGKVDGLIFLSIFCAEHNKRRTDILLFWNGLRKWFYWTLS